MATHTWFRVEFDGAGERVSCRAVSTGYISTQATVFYVLALDEDRAWRKAHSLRMGELQRARWAERRAAGKCQRCGIGKYNGTTRCDEYCKPAANRRDRNERTAAAAPDSALAHRPLEPELGHNERLRLQVLKECLS